MFTPVPVGTTLIKTVETFHRGYSLYTMFQA